MDLNHHIRTVGATAKMTSLVIPVKNEMHNVVPLAARIDKAMVGFLLPWECVWVDDGSTDDTSNELTRMVERSHQHSCVLLDGPYGQSAALAVGFEYARGDIIVTLDGDGQNPPEEIPRLVHHLIDGDFDMVCGYRTRRYSYARLMMSRIANGFRNAVTADKIRDVGCSLRAFRAECVADLFVFRGMHRFLPTLVRIAGYNRIVEVPVGNAERRQGRTKYGMHNRLWVGIVDTLGVRWMAKRKVVPKVRAIHPQTAQHPEAVSTATYESTLSQESSG
jgi:dolichol-phosphate mannosyltransferase